MSVPHISDSQVFARYADSSLERWNVLIGCPIQHVRHNKGVITEVKRNSLGWVTLLVEFENTPTQTLKIPGSALLFQNAFIEALPPNMSCEDINKYRKELQDEELQKIEDRRLVEEARLAQEQRVLEEQERKRKNELLKEEEEKHRRLEEQERRDAEERQKALEREASIEFAQLKGKYSANTFWDDSPSSRLNVILSRMEDNKILLGEEISWLKSNKVFGPLAHFYERQFDRTGDLWHCVRASAYWRGCGLPEESLYITEFGLKNTKLKEDRSKAALLTTRGGAFRDLRRLNEAESIGLEAIAVNPDAYQPYNLMGGIYIDKGEPSKADHFFELAQQHGAPLSYDTEIKHAIENAGLDEARIAAQYLLDKNTARYQWATYYL